MTIKFWVKEHGTGAVCSGILPDGAYDKETCIIVSERPSMAHRWDNKSKEWTLSISDKQDEIRGHRSPELTRTDKYMISDYNLKFSIEEQAEIIAYRQDLRDAPDKATVEELVMPICPDCIKL